MVVIKDLTTTLKLLFYLRQMDLNNTNPLPYNEQLVLDDLINQCLYMRKNDAS